MPTDQIIRFLGRTRLVQRTVNSVEVERLKNLNKQKKRKSKNAGAEKRFRKHLELKKKERLEVI